MLPIPYRAFANPAELEELRLEAESALKKGNDAIILDVRTELAGVYILLGDGIAAIDHAREALNVSVAANGVHPEMLNVNYAALTLGAAHCHNGNYEAGQSAFAQAEAGFAHLGDTLGVAWYQHIYAREYLRDRGDYAQALNLLGTALAVLRTRAMPAAVIENLLTQADCMINLGEARRAKEVLKQAEDMVAHYKNTWYRPEAALLRANMYMREINFRQAWVHCYAGLGAAGNGGDLRMLTPLYTVLGTALENDHDKVDDARDALERAISAGRTRARGLFLALALRQMGLHLKRFSNRPTARARGSGFLFEADKMFQQMGLSQYLAPRNAAAH